MHLIRHIWFTNLLAGTALQALLPFLYQNHMIWRVPNNRKERQSLRLYPNDLNSKDITTIKPQKNIEYIAHMVFFKKKSWTWIRCEELSSMIIHVRRISCAHIYGLFPHFTSCRLIRGGCHF